MRKRTPRRGTGWRRRRRRRGLLATAEMAIVGFVIAFILGVVFGLFAASGKRALVIINRIYVEFFQNTPLMLQALFLFYAVTFSGGTGFTPLLAGMICLGVYHGAYFSEVIRAGIEAIPKGQVETGSAQGFTFVQVMIHIVLPQAIRAIVPTMLSQIITTIKDTSYVANIACIEFLARIFTMIQRAPDFTKQTSQNISDVFVLCGLASIIYFVINFALSCLVRSLQKKQKLPPGVAAAARKLPH